MSTFDTPRRKRRHEAGISLVDCIVPFQITVLPFKPKAYHYVLDTRRWTPKFLEKYVVQQGMRGVAYRLRAIQLDGKGFLEMSSQTKLNIRCDLSQWRQLSTLSEVCNKNTAACILQKAIRAHQNIKLAKKYDMSSKIVREIVTTEQTYVQQLDVVVDLIMKPLKKTNKEKEIITKEQFRAIFNGLASIQKTNQLLLENLMSTCSVYSQSTRVGDVFLQFTPYLKMYSDYCKMYNTVSDIVCVTLKAPHPFALFVADQMKHAPTTLRNHSLTSLLITPIQRLPRYRMLVEDLLKNYSKDSVDYPSLLEAQKKINEVAYYVNEMSRVQESTEMLLYFNKITSGLPDGLTICAPGRSYISRVSAEFIEVIINTQKVLITDFDDNSDDYFEMSSSTPVEKEVDFPETVHSDVTVVLFNDILLLLTANLGASIVNTGLRFLSVVGLTQSKNYEGFNYMQHFKLNEITVIKSDEDPCVDIVIPNEEHKTLKFQSEKERDDWFELASIAVEKHKILVKSLEERRSGVFKNYQMS
ncbi:Guanine nucleotide exchange factor [Entamoeba marina]